MRPRIRIALACLALLLASLFAEARETNMTRSDLSADATAKSNAVPRVEAGHLNADNNIWDLLNHPAFRGYSRLLMPWSDRTYDEDIRLGDIGSLLPYHSHVDSKTVLAGLNHIIDEVNSGRLVFYDFYTEAHKRADPTKEHAGLFFFRGKPRAPFAIISPGGGFSYVGSMHEGFPYAVVISAKGYNAFVLKYRAGHGGDVATQDSGGSTLLHIPKCRNAWRRYGGLRSMGQFRWRENGGGHRVTWRCCVWRRRSSQTGGRRDGLHRAFRHCIRRAPYFCCRW